MRTKGKKNPPAIIQQPEHKIVQDETCDSTSSIAIETTNPIKKPPISYKIIITATLIVEVILALILAAIEIKNSTMQKSSSRINPIEIVLIAAMCVSAIVCMVALIAIKCFDNKKSKDSANDQTYSKTLEEVKASKATLVHMNEENMTTKL